MSGQFPEQKQDWCNLDVIHRNVLPSRSYFFLYETEKDALSANTDLSSSIKLSGTWKFHHSNSPFEAPQGFEAPTYDTSKWSDIQVPGIWQLQGWGKPHYTNVPYPFFVDPPNVPFDDNQTGSYARKFKVPEKFANQDLRLRFEGVDSAFHVYVNGQPVGYSQGSRNPSEFDITKIVDFSGENTLAVQVYQYCDGSYLEDQDQWRFSGIFRDVLLLAFPSDSIQDFQLHTILDDEYKDAELKVKVSTKTTNPNIVLKLLDTNGAEVVQEAGAIDSSAAEYSLKIANPKKWSAEEPNLYKLVLSFSDRHIAQNVGFRRIEIKNGIYLVNGKRIVFRGANRHEHHPKYGRAVPYEFMKHDLLTMKRYNLNALRTSHQPSDPRLYALADELGLWIMDEADVECHGFSTVDELALSPEDRKRPFDERKELVYGNSARFTSDNPDWKHHYVDRALQLVHRDKNHPCVVMWSLGNEAFYGCNFRSMYDEIKKIDQSRPIHYEGDFGTGSARSISEPETVDIVSRMYPRIEDIIDFAKRSDITKPLVLCEYIHAMGNGPGNIKEYINAFYQHQALQGGWVWEWANHGLKTKDDKTGVEYYAYGGDYGDEPNDYNFIMDGVLFSDHTPTPGLVEYKKAIEPVQVESYDEGVVTIINRYDTASLEYLKCEACLIGDGYKKPLGELPIPVNVAPHTRASIKLPTFDTSDIEGEVYLQVDFSIPKDNVWAAAGHVVSSSQLQLQPASAISTLPATTSAPEITSTPSTLTVATSTTTYTLSLPAGRLTSILKLSTELLHSTSGPVLTLFRAITDNDRPQDGQDWLLKHLELTKPHTYSVTWSTQTDKSLVEVVVKQKVGPPSLSWYLDTTVTHTFHSSGQLHMHTKAVPKGPNLPLTLPRLGLQFSMPKEFNGVSWFGRGPGESYRDKKLSQNFGNYEASVDELWVDYEFPQENGNRTDVRHITFTSSKPSGNLLEQVKDLTLGVQKASSTLTARFGQQEEFSFQASHYDARDIETAQHPYELRKFRKEEVIVRLDAMHHGLGTGSCGPKTRPEYALMVEEGNGWEFDIWLE